MRKAFAFPALVFLLLPGCVDPEGLPDPGTLLLPETTDPRLPATAGSPRVVVALVDSGINFYHEWFQRDASLSDEVLSQFTDQTGAAPIRVPISHEGNWTQRVAADAKRLAELRTGQLYYFEGTNVLGISFRPGELQENQFLFLTGGSHGTGTSGAVVQNNPNAIVVMVQGNYNQGEQWVAATPWIDVISMSYGPPGSVPGMGAVFELNTHANTKVMAKNGKIPVGAADNSPALAPNDETAGPPWVIGVAGDHPTTGCRAHNSGSVPDFTSDFTQELPRVDDTHNLTSMSGTSFATPKTAGTFSRVVFETRIAWGHAGGIEGGALAQGPDGQTLTFAGLREAFNRTATYFGQSECDPKPGTSLPVNSAAPWAQQGWGHIGPEIANATVDHVLGVRAAPEKPDDAMTFQEAAYRYRATLWNLT